MFASKSSSRFLVISVIFIAIAAIVVNANWGSLSTSSASVSAPETAATFVVNDTSDAVDASPGDGICATAGATCTLRAAISEANALAGADTITLPAGTYTTTIAGSNENLNANGDYDITSAITINGAGSGTTIIQANAAPATGTERVFNIVTTPGVTVDINNVTIQNGNATGVTSGGGISLEVASILNLTNVVLTNNRIAPPAGNNAFGGGMIMLAGTATLTNCTVSNNSAVAVGGTTVFGFAGGIYNQQATLNVINSTVTGNIANSFHGGIRTLSQTISSVTNITNSTVSNNISQGIGGAGFEGEGGGMANFNVGTSAAITSTITITGSTISGNQAQVSSAPGAATTAGGLENFSNSLGLATYNISNSTISGNSAADAGGVYNIGTASTVNLDYSTVAANSATNNGGGLYQDTSGAINLKDSIVADNSAAPRPGDSILAGSDIFGTITSQDYNHVESTAGGTFAPMANDVTGSDPALGALANNGGPTLTHLPGGASPVLNTIPSGTAGCGTTVAFDQRAFIRPGGGACEKGSVEISVAATPTNTVTATPTATSTFTPTATFTATNTATPTPTATANPLCAFSNGGLNPQPLTDSGVAAPAGFFWSEVQHNTGNLTESNTSAGFSGSVNSATVFFRLADNFTISQPCILNSVALYSYQTGGPATSPFTAYTLQIWNGRPGDVGSAVVFGDTTTNRLATSVDSTYYRIFNTAVPPPGTVQGTTRKIWRNTVTIGTTLPAGTYWLDWNSTTAPTVTHFDPSKTIAGSRGGPLDDARQFVGSTGLWGDALDTGNPATAPDYKQDFPFDISGAPVGSTATATATASPTPTFTSTATATATATATPPDTVCDLVEGFDDITNMPGWVQDNNSVPGGTTGWFQGNDTVFPAHTGALTSYIGANFNNTTGDNTISNWLMTAPVQLQDGGQLTFWTRTTTANPFPDRLEVRLSTNGTSTNVGTLPTDVGDFTTLLLTINPTLIVGPTGYPEVWTQYTVTISGVPSPVKGRLAFRYFVTNGGPAGANSNYIGIDTFEYHCNAGPTATATDTPTATATETPTPADTPSISGTITYGNAIGAPAPPRFVKNVTVQSTAGAPPVGPVITGLPGTYTLTGFGAGAYTIKPTKPGGPNGAISSFDAGRTAQGVSGAVAFVSQNQRFTADASGGGGNVSSLDAAKIAQFAAGLPTVPPNNTGLWKFFVTGAPSPLPTPPQTYNDNRSYATVTSVLTGEDYIGLLVGDVTGNWNPAIHARPAMGPERTAAVTAPRLVTPADNEVIIPVSVQGVANKDVIAYEFDLRYDPMVIQPQAEPVDVAGTVSRALSVVTNPYEPGLLRVVVYGAYPIDENGLLLNLRFTAVGAPGSVSPLVFERIMFNEGDPGTLVTDGEVELMAGAPNQAEITGRLLNSMGQGVPNARVKLTDTTGESRSAVSNGFGVYRFGGLQVGQTYTLSVESRGLSFTPLTVSVTSQSVSVDLIAGQ